MVCRHQLCFFIAVFTACAAPKPSMSAEEAFGHSNKAATSSAPPSPRELKGWAKSFKRPSDCHRGARDLEAEHGHDTGWLALQACVARGDFSLLPELLTWAADLRSHPEGPRLVAQVVAAYGGANLAEATAAARAHSLALFDLASALDAPRASTGKTVLMLGRPGQLSARSPRQNLLLAEVALGSAGSAPQPSLPSHNRVAPTVNADGSKSYSKEWTPDGEGTMKRWVTAEEHTQYDRETQANKAALAARNTPPPAWTGNSLAETGAEVKAKLPAELSLSEGKDYVLLVRVDGSVKEPPGEGEAVPTLRLLTTVLGAWELDVRRSEFIGR
jgi:hypothetical protein